MISVKCQNCGKSYRVKPEFEGKKFRCQQCNSVVVISAAPLDPISLGMDPAPILPPPLSTTPSFTFPNQPIPNSNFMTGAVGIQSAGAVVLPKIKTAKKKTPPLSQITRPFLVGLFGTAVFAIVAFIAITIFTPTILSEVLLYFMLPVCLIVVATCQLGILRTAFRESSSCGIYCLVVPGYALYYMFSRWRYTARYVSVLAVHAGSLVIIVLFSVVQVINHGPLDPPESAPPLTEAEMIRLDAEKLANHDGRTPLTVRVPTEMKSSEDIIAAYEKSKRESEERAFARLAEAQKRSEQLQSRGSRPASSDDSSSESKGQSFSTAEVEGRSAPVEDLSTLKVGDPIFALHLSKWYECKVVEPAQDGKVKIHFLGWSDVWDELVPQDHLRRPK